MLDKVRKACEIAEKKVACMLDTKGPEIRTGLLKDGQAINLTAGQQLDVVFPPQVRSCLLPRRQQNPSHRLWQRTQSF